MPGKPKHTCELCGGKVSSPRRGITLPTAVAVHEQSCPGSRRVKKEG